MPNSNLSSESKNQTVAKSVRGAGSVFNERKGRVEGVWQIHKLNLGRVRINALKQIEQKLCFA